jgi:hypothetical protein
MGRYAAVVLVAVLLAGGIGELALFKQTALGTPKLSAAGLVRFLGYGGALVMLWLLGQRAAKQLRAAAGKTAHLGFLIVPLATLIALSVGYDVLLAILRPLLATSHRQVYNWVFVLGISASAVWLIVVLYQHSEGLIELLRTAQPRASRSEAKCAACGAGLPQEAKFCPACGNAAPSQPAA